MRLTSNRSVSTGDKEELSTESKTKDNAVPAGLSPPPLLWRVLTPLEVVDFSRVPSLNSLIAYETAMVAMVV